MSGLAKLPHAVCCQIKFVEEGQEDELSTWKLSVHGF